MDLAHDAIIIRDPASRVESWNGSAARLYGWTAKEAAGQITHTLLDTVFPAGQEAADEALFRDGHWEGRLQHRCKDGRRIVVESKQSLLRDPNGEPLLIKEINRDVTQQRRQLNYLRLLSEVSSWVNEAATVEDALRSSLASICNHSNWCAACACTVTREKENGEVRTAFVWFVTDEKRFGAFRGAMDAAPALPNAKSVAERVFRKGEPVWIRDLRKDAYFAPVFEQTDAPLRSAYGFPVVLGPKVGIAIILFSEVPVEIDESLTGTMSGVGRHLGRLFERLRAQDTQRALAISVMRAQDDERRRVARELHDSTGQYLAALALAVDAARTNGGVPAGAVRKLEEASEIINHCSAEVRTLSHLLHPPLLEELGLASAVNWYVQGFAERSGLKIEVQVPARLPRFDHSAELALFRALQESLTNIHRHSGSKTASVKIDASDDLLTLEVRDQGTGIESDTLGDWFGKKRRPGVGISGMRERMKDLGGTLEIASTLAGATVRATVPVRAATASSAEAAPLADPLPAAPPRAKPVTAGAK